MAVPSRAPRRHTKASNARDAGVSQAKATLRCPNIATAAPNTLARKAGVSAPVVGAATALLAAFRFAEAPVEASLVKALHGSALVLDEEGPIGAPNAGGSEGIAGEARSGLEAARTTPANGCAFRTEGIGPTRPPLGTTVLPPTASPRLGTAGRGCLHAMVIRRDGVVAGASPTACPAPPCKAGRLRAALLALEVTTAPEAVSGTLQDILDGTASATDKAGSTAVALRHRSSPKGVGCSNAVITALASITLGSLALEMRPTPVTYTSTSASAEGV